MQITKSNTIAKMKYVIQCFISDKTGNVVKVGDYQSENDFWALEYAYTKACEFYNDVLPVPDNGRYEDYIL